MPATPTLHQRILDAACQLFLQDGYRVSMDAVAQHACVSKQTVYTHFRSKDALFRAAVENLVMPMHASLDSHPDNLEDSLRAFATTYSRQAFDPSTAALGRMLVAEAPRFPRAARQLYQSGAGAVLERLAARLARSMHLEELRPDDPDRAAELFLSMLNGMTPQRSLLGLRQRGRKAQDKWASHAVNVFVRAYQFHSPSSDQPSRKSP